MGVPSVFLRTFGCNFTCSGFGMPRGEPSIETNKIIELNATKPYKTYNELPLVSTGCDSYASWHPKLKHLSPLMTTDAIVERIMELLPYNSWHDEHLVITGGEPLLGWQRAFPDLLSHPKMSDLKEITFETNGTQKLSLKFEEYLTKWEFGGPRVITFSVSPKLPASGENWKEAINPNIVSEYQNFGHVYLKFVVATEQDINDALIATEEFRNNGFIGNVYLMPVGGVESVYNLNNKTVALAAMKHGLRYSDRLQVPLFKNEWGT